MGLAFVRHDEVEPTHDGITVTNQRTVTTALIPQYETVVIFKISKHTAVTDTKVRSDKITLSLSLSNS